MRVPVYATIPTHVTLLGRGGVGACPGARDADLTRTQLKNNLPIRPLISVASLCLFPVALFAQPATSTPPAETVSPVDTSQPGASQPSGPSLPSAPSVPTLPSQAAGVPPQGGLSYPGAAYQPVETQGPAVGGAGEPTYQFRVLAGVEHETNPLRLPGSSGSDQVGILGVGFKADKRYGLQRIRADIEADTYKYNSESSLDYTTLNYGLAWDWQFTPRIHGVVSADRKQYRDVSTDPIALVNRVGRRTERNEVAEGIYELGAAWRLLAGVSRSSASTTVANSWDASPTVRSARVGAGYELGSGSSLFARYRRGDGEYTNVAPGLASADFKENETDLLLKWPLTGKTSVEARIGHLERKHSSAPQLDFSGVVGNAAVNWAITGKTRLAAGYSHDLTATGLATGGHVESDRFYIGPVWNATAQISVNARYDRVARDWKDVPAGSPDLGRNEKIQALSAGIDWEPRRWLTVTTYVRGERLTSNLNTGYRSTTYGAALKAYF